MPSTPLVINRPDSLVPHFRDVRPILALADPPARNVWYDVLPTSSDVLGQYFAVMQENTGADVEDLEVMFIGDGVVATGPITNAVSGTFYYVFFNAVTHNLGNSVNVTGMKIDFPYYAQSMRLRMRHTSVVGAGARLYGRVRYEQL